MIKIKTLFVSSAFFLLAGCDALQTQNQVTYFSVPKPLWLAGIQSDLTAYTEDYPVAVQSKHFSVINSGFWIVPGKKPQAALGYEYTLNVTQPFEQAVYIKMTLENPADPSSPFVYESELQPERKSSSVRHYPVTDVELDAQYTMRLEVFSDADLKNRIDQVEQILVSPVDNSTGSIILSEAYKNVICSPITTDSLVVMPWTCHL